MTRPGKLFDPQRVFCDVCFKRVAKSDALIVEERDAVVHFCGAECYRKWHARRAASPATSEPQESTGRSPSRDDRMKKLGHRHPERSG